MKVQSKKTRQDDNIPDLGKSMNEPMDMLLDELQWAIAWSRPSILFAIQGSKIDQTTVIPVMDRKLKSISKEVVHVGLVGGENILNHILQGSASQDVIIFVRDLGNQLSIYHGLNMIRETIVEQRLKIVFWLTREELTLFANNAPDFWSFRHRVIEFPSRRTSSKKSGLPSGLLLWHINSPIMSIDTAREKLVFHETLLQNIPSRGETVVNYVRELGHLSYYHWLLGENEKVTSLIEDGLKLLDMFELKDMRSMLLNVLAINCFDRGNFQEAFQRIEQALMLSPSQGLLWSNHGVMCRFASQTRKSISSLKKGAKLNPDSWDSRGVLGYVYMSLGRYASAIPNFEKALTLRPEMAHFLPAIAVCHSLVGNSDSFEKIIQQLLNVSKENDYFSICFDGLLGNASKALEQLKKWMVEKRIPSVFLNRDPNLYFIFNSAAMQNLFEDVSSSHMVGK